MGGGRRERKGKKEIGGWPSDAAGGQRWRDSGAGEAGDSRVEAHGSSKVEGEGIWRQ